VIKGIWYPKGSADRKEASLLIDDSTKFSVIHKGGKAELAAGDFLKLVVSDRIGNITRRLTLPDQSVFETLDNDGIDAYLKKHTHPASSRHFVYRMESSKIMLFFSLVAIIVLALSLKWSLPWASGLIAENFPQEAKEYISEESLAVMDVTVFNASEIDTDTQDKIQKHFNNTVLPALGDSSLDTDIFSLHFRKLALPIEGTPEIANAFAFPGGDIIITDELIRIAENQQEIDAILYHEIAHVLHNHGLKQVVQSTLVTAIIAMIVDGESLLEDILIGLPVFFFQNHYSKKYETEADIFAFELMLKTNINPTVFSSILGKISMDKKEAAQNDKQDSNYFSTHPTTNDRVEMAAKYAKQFSEQQAPGNVNP